MYFALIKNGVVKNVIVAEQAWVDANLSGLGYDSAVGFADDAPGRPAPGYTYDGVTFTPGDPDES